jgi:hypothetical protein
MTDRPQKITFAEMRDSGCAWAPDLLRGLPLQRLDRDQRRPMARTSCASLVMLLPLAKPVRILSYCGFDPLMGRPFASKSGRPCQPLEIALPTKNRSCSRRPWSRPTARRFEKIRRVTFKI